MNFLTHNQDTACVQVSTCHRVILYIHRFHLYWKERSEKNGKHCRMRRENAEGQTKYKERWSVHTAKATRTAKATCTRRLATNVHHLYPVICFLYHRHF